MTLPSHSAQAIDEISKEIIEQLQEDGRRSYAAIGKAVGLSEAAVRQRVQKLVESRVMQIVAVTNPLELGFTRQAMIGVVANDDISGTADRIAELPEVDYCVVTTGSSDILAEVICSNDEDLLRVIGTIRGIQGVVSTNTFTYLSLKKQEYNWGTR
ncbi:MULTISPECIES: Lrp/AsnC family transcriptional regulator [Glutamicibacter]|uniref:Lrp/AsnC family transcriptional regulator n=1 Tax=Glutamicibacter halophytocola TaxID=1933880 RepID=A0A5B8IKA6_9MICC|nr:MULTISPECIES: Lrp/AsnC family transcriptional regulator [Glutamicibacter]ALG29869.1 AsnC family transcriptional regulator [Glutamicibacter halophytocola]MBF6672932.1 Lrp/AsnC family transcriptional regulator [Glutamicibacter sp. FBE19]NQD41346.1 Lrp/AsnC family transcriptional regulator [Glutamicibacter halophytocola]QDY66124.1 Lrp/AsnC family transcriptional regulator [Glutamicibacter halophytocola]UUX58226.1 Lrp/AsnC family transcriptional regulator [Glutamicibacter halophytocola]